MRLQLVSLHPYWSATTQRGLLVEKACLRSVSQESLFCLIKQFQEEENTDKCITPYNYINFHIPKPLDELQILPSLHADCEAALPRII